MRSTRRSTPNAASCDDQEFTARVPDDEDPAGARDRMGRGLPPRRRPRPEGCSGGTDGGRGRSPSGRDGRARRGRPAQRQLPPLADDGAGRDRAQRPAHAELERARGGARLRPARGPHRPHDPRLLRARAVHPQGRHRPTAHPRPADQRRHGEPGRQDLGCGGRRLPPPALEGHLSGLDARRRGAGAQDRHGRAPPPRPGGPWWPWA